jgi:hypothetical protein
MALPSVGGGYQPSDGNVNEVKLGTQNTPATAAGDATLTVAQITNGILLGSPGSSAAAYTLPLAASVDAALNAAHNGSSFDFSVINVDGSGSGVITMTTNTGWSIGTSGSQGLMTIAATAGTVRRFRAVRTGAAAWSLYALS